MRSRSFVVGCRICRGAWTPVQRFGAGQAWSVGAVHPDDSFDVVVAQYVITAVPHPEATLDEFARVLKPGGEIVLVNHIGAEEGPRRLFEQWFAPRVKTAIESLFDEAT